jgi:hypothetical protein
MAERLRKTLTALGAPLDKMVTTVDLTRSNLLMVVCNSADGGNAVHLALSVNGRRLLDVNANSPVARGTVALFAATTGNTSTADEVQFRRFTVTQ